METNPYQQHAYSPYGQSTGPSSNQSTSQQQQQTAATAAHQQASAPTLPPLQQAQQSQNGYSFGNLSYGQTSSQSSTPTTPHNASMPGAQQQPHPYPQHMSPVAGTGSMAPPTGYANPYNPSNMMYPTSTSSPMTATSSAGLLPNLRPMPPGGMMGAGGSLPSLAQTGQQLGQLGQAPTFLQDEQQPTHVVGSQGRRGILPSAPGRPNPPAQGTGTTAKSMIPQKDADGKYPCPHCNKTYLHAKHLKRHLLRHTGDRPYMCHLCKDTFSRSDILKRHFQKCSLRRGNPTGANHLAHQRKNTNNGNRLSISQQEGPVGLAGMPDVAGANNTYNANVVGSSPNVNGDVSARSSRANSLIGAASMNNRSSLAGLGILGSNTSGVEQVHQTSAPYQPGMHAYAMQNAQNAQNGGHLQQPYSFQQPHMNGNVYHGQQTSQQQQQQQQHMSFLGQQSSRFANSQMNTQQMSSTEASGVDWTRMFTQGGQDGFIGSHSANASSQGNTQIKPEPDAKQDYPVSTDFSNESFLGSLYSHPGGFGGEISDHGIPGFPNWGMDDPLQAKVDSLLHHCFPNGVDQSRNDAASLLMQNVLNVDKLKHFAEHYTSFHGHWPILHMPTFKLTNASNNLVLAMLCIGAVYSPELGVHQTRQLMEFVKTTVYANCRIYNRTMKGQIEGLGDQAFEIEELQALSMLQTTFTWHGDAAQRQGARAEFPTLVKIAKAMNLCDSAPAGHHAYSLLHNTRQSHANMFQTQNWNWSSWLEQEKRNRALYQLLITDAAMVTYFNCTPLFDPLEIRLMLPADDAAWDAISPQDCANALGLNGPQSQGKNLTGTRKPIQPQMRDAMRTLLDPHSALQPGATNVYSKFMLVHALLIRIVNCQKALLGPDQPMQPFTLNLHGSAPVTPLSQHEWPEQNGNNSRPPSANNSGHATPMEAHSPMHQSALAAQQEKKRLATALEKWKRNWDADMELQYPSMHFQQRRFGFVRDGVHFFYLGRAFLQSQKESDFTQPADLRFKRVVALLKRIKASVVDDNEAKGHDIGSVGDIDDQYGLDNLTLDMKLLFRPYNSQLDSPVAGVQTQTV